MKRFYDFEDNEEENEAKEDKVDEEDTPSLGIDPEQLKRLEKLQRMSRGEINASDVSQSSSESENESEENENEVESSSKEDGIEQEIINGNPTRRLAVMNLDWENLSSVDLLAVFQVLYHSKGLFQIQIKRQGKILPSSSYFT